MNPWIGVDLDGTLARYGSFQGAEVIGEPVPAMADRVLRWLSEGKEVRVFTARVATDGTPERLKEVKVARRAIKEWCRKHLGQALKVTCKKDYGMVELWDDRCVQVNKNTGEPAVVLAYRVAAEHLLKAARRFEQDYL